MNIVFFTFYYSPDLCAGSFRATALVEALSKKLSDDDYLHVITTHPNRYAAHSVEAEDVEVNGNIVVHRIAVPKHQGGMISQSRTFFVYVLSAAKLCYKLKPDFLIGTTSRLMTGVLTWFSARIIKRNYYVDLRDIFSETISDLFARKNKTLGYITKKIFSAVEKRFFNGAAGVNVVSEGFPEYFQDNSIDTSSWSFYPNGVDKEFINFPPAKDILSQKVKTILYAGNIGNGQGLETIIPSAAKRLGSGYRFVVVGDGGTKSLLKMAIERDGLTNVELLPPVSRVKLIEYYKKADILFLHLNDIPAFRRVLPSKIFEYAALGRPIVAGLNGYSAKFISTSIPYACLFEPGDSNGAESCIRNAANLKISGKVVSNFVDTFSRFSIMDKMADNILQVAVRS
ncbi:MAG: glycosyltransferase family 4 protein [Gammaproteobacteria bacterium]|nr:glycosyltransferase family 4 protein [Gammaproteobacteria bacterium]